MITGDDTDDESKPKRTIPNWARNKVALAESLKKQSTCTDSNTLKSIFGPYPKTADLDDLFGTVNKVFDKLIIIITSIRTHCLL